MKRKIGRPHGPYRITRHIRILPAIDKLIKKAALKYGGRSKYIEALVARDAELELPEI